MTPALRERSVLWTNQAPTVLKQLMRHALGASHAVLVAPDLFSSKGDASEVARIIAGREGAIVLWDAPAHPKSSLLHLYRLHALIPGAPLVLARIRNGDRRVADQLELCYPDRDRLGRIYIALKEATKRVPAPGMSNCRCSRGEVARHCDPSHREGRS